LNASGCAGVVQRSQKSTAAADPQIPRIPTWRTVVVGFAAERWARNISQIPATVIDVGVLRYVPYKSHRCADTFEINVYGDPDSPAGFEVGIVDPRDITPERQKDCLAFVSKMLGDPTDKKVLALLDAQEDVITRRGLTLEITPPTAPDAYGGWWISVYDETKLDSERASEAELAQITQAKAAKSTVSPKERPNGQPSTQTSNDNPEDALSHWSTSELTRARPTRNETPNTRTTAPTASPSTYSGGAVYVRGYLRKDGTYVRPHTRRK